MAKIVELLRSLDESLAECTEELTQSESDHSTWLADTVKTNIKKMQHEMCVLRTPCLTG